MFDAFEQRVVFKLEKLHKGFERRMLLKLEVMQEGFNSILTKVVDLLEGQGYRPVAKKVEDLLERPLETLEEMVELCHRLQADNPYKKKIARTIHSTFSYLTSFLIWHSHDRSFDFYRFST